MKIINSYIKSLKLANHFILTVPSNPKLSTSLQPTVNPFLHQPQDHRKQQKSNRKVRKKYIKVNTTCKNIENQPEG